MTSRPGNNRQVFAILNEARLASRDDRLMVASQILGNEFDSFTDLSDDNMADLKTALNDWRTVEAARSSTGALTVDALQHLLNLSIPEALTRELLAQCESLGLPYVVGDDASETTLTTPIYTGKDI